MIKNRIKFKDSDFKDAFQRVLDQRTLVLIGKLIKNQKINKLIGIINQGKEANIYLARDINDMPIALKIYKIDINSSKWMKRYISGDPRFNKIG
ncbi:MAG: RIO1 family regulatory kinase/ATPase, partial [Candidatus Aenigmatarchaeota archaeon]